jgi:hypothetical protein
MTVPGIHRSEQIFLIDLLYVYIVVAGSHIVFKRIYQYSNVSMGARHSYFIC